MRTICCFLLCLCFSAAFAQDPLDAKMSQLAKAKPYGAMFIHFDKNVYSNNETVYFTAYLIQSALSPLNQHQVLCVNLVREIDTALVLTEKFAIEKGLSMGSITLPDSIQSGNYRLMAFTNQVINGKPEVSFVQKITLKTNFEPPYKANLKILETTSSPNLTHKVLFSATTSDNRFLPQPIIIDYRYGNLRKKTKTDQSGQVLLSLPVPPTVTDPNLYVKLTGEKDTSYLSLALPMAKSKASVNFFPEGGNAVIGLPNYIAWEVKDQQQMPIALKAFLYKNDQVVDTIETGSLGIGKFRLFHEQNAVYTVKLIHDGVVDSIYGLPKALNEGLVLNLPKAVATDSISFSIRTSKPKNIQIRLHNFRETFVSATYTSDVGFRKFKIPLNDVPKGLATLTITDSLDRPLAERMIFAHYPSSGQLNLTTNKEQYGQREEVSLKLNLEETALPSIVSIAVVQENRLDKLKTNDIETYLYLQNEIGQVPSAIKGTLFKDRDAIEQLLLVKGWRRYTWQTLQETIDTTTAKPVSLTMTGKVWRKSKELTAPITLSVLGDKKIRVTTTSANGLFDFNEADYFTDPSRKTYLMVNHKFREDFRVKIDDQFLKLARQTRELGTDKIVPPSALTNNAELVIKGNEKAIRLKEVVIKSASKDEQFKFSAGSGPNACGDYVCFYNIFNCKNHIGDAYNKAPVPGKTYSGLIGPYLECKVYSSVDESYVQFKGIHFAKEFYHNDYKDPLEPAFFSTIYWNYGVLLNAKQPTEIKFYTSDITGRFKVVIQGISGRDFVHSEKTFEVKGK